jgi:cyclophilin family peptidyl-prolyl cis-trans isomerase
MSARLASLAALCALTLVSPEPGQEPSMTLTDSVAEIVTSKGTLVLELHPAIAPKHVANLTKLAGDGFYDGLAFHRIIPGFMIQGGCPKGDGTGGPGWKLQAEFNDRPHARGSLSMARAGHPDSAGSQFFICHQRAPHLDGKYTNFGTLLSGFDVLDAIAAQGSQGGQPKQKVTIESLKVRPRTADDVAEQG